MQPIGGLRQLIRLIVAASACLGWAAAMAAQQPQTLAGGGHRAAAGNLRLNGVIADVGPPAGGFTGNANGRLAVGFFPALTGLIANGYNAALRVWLELTDEPPAALPRTPPAAPPHSSEKGEAR